jgi:sugar phosphate isomerase/epimerase
LKLSNYSLNYSDKIGRAEMDVFRFLRLCRELGLDGASLHLRDLPGTKSETLAKVRRAYLDEGLSVTMLSISSDFGRPGPWRYDEFNQARDAIRVAAFLGAPLLRVFAGSSGDAAARPRRHARHHLRAATAGRRRRAHRPAARRCLPPLTAPQKTLRATSAAHELMRARRGV